MAKTAVIYQSKYGSTKQYAEWIAEDLGADLYKNGKIKAEELKSYSTIVFGGGLYAENIAGISFIVKNIENFKDKNIIVFTCGLVDINKEYGKNSVKNIIDKTFSKEIQEKIKFFSFRGAIDYTKLCISHKMMMKMFTKLIAKKAEKSSHEGNEMLTEYGENVDYKNKKFIDPLVQYVKQL